MKRISRTAHAHVKLFPYLLSERSCASVVEAETPPGTETRIKDMMRHDGVFQNGSVDTGAHLASILRNEGDQSPSGQDVGMRNVLAIHLECPRCHCGETHDCVHQLELTVPLDAGNANDLAGAHFNGHVVQPRPVFAVTAIETLRAEYSFPGFLWLAPRCEQDLSAYHLASQILFREFGRSGRTNDLAAPHDGHAIAQGQDFVEPVGNKDDRVPFVSETSQFGEQLRDLLRRQNCRRLVQNKHGDIPVQQFENLDLLARSYRNIPYDCVRIQVELKLLDLLAHRFTRPVSVDCPEGSDGLGAQKDVRQDAVHRDQQHFQVYHANPGSNRLTWRPDLDHCPPEKDLARVCAFEAVEHLHQRALSSPVLADDRVDFPGCERNRGVGQGYCVRGENLGNVLQVDQDVTCHDRELSLLVLGDWKRPVDDLLTDFADAIDDSLGKYLYLGVRDKVNRTGLETVLDYLARLVGPVLDGRVDLFDGLAHVLDVRRDDVTRFDIVLIRVDADRVQATLLGSLQNTETRFRSYLEYHIAFLVIEAQRRLLALAWIIPDPGEHNALYCDSGIDVVDAILVRLHESHDHGVIRRCDNAHDLVGVDVLDAGVCRRESGTHASQECTLFLNVLAGSDRVLGVLNDRVNVDEYLVGVLVRHRLETVLEGIGNHEDDVAVLHGSFQPRLVLPCVEVALDCSRFDAILALDLVDALLAGIVERVVTKGTIDEVDDLVGLGTGYFRLAARKRQADEHQREQHTQYSLHVDSSPLSSRCPALGKQSSLRSLASRNAATSTLSGIDCCAPGRVTVSAPAAIARRSTVPGSNPRSSDAANAPWKESPAAVVSTAATRNAGTSGLSNAPTANAPFSPRFTTTVRAPRPRRVVAASLRSVTPASARASPSFGIR